MVLVKVGEFVIGAFYELPDGRIAKTLGWDSRSKEISYRLDDGEGSRIVHEAIALVWKRRSDLRDFPNASDPLLPYDFDLWWDIKYMSQLRRELVGHDHEDEIREMMGKFEITI